MSASLTFGSFGDAITTVQLVYRLAQALSASHGSAREFQDLVVELRIYQSLLQQLMIFWESRRQSPELSELAKIVRPTITDCKDVIEAFIEQAVRKYGRTLLRQTGSRKGLWDMVKMVQWNLCEKEHVEKLRNQLSRSQATIQMVQTQAHELARERDHAVVSERIVSLVDDERQADAKIDARFAELLEKLEEGSKKLSRIEEISNTVFSTVSSISSTVLRIEQSILILPGMISRLGFYRYNTVYIEDALGWKLPIILDVHPSWETVHSIIQDQFARNGSPGLQLVRSKRYTLQDRRTGRDANFSLPFHQAARPGETLDMSMVFHGDWDDKDEIPGKEEVYKCPSCGHPNMSYDQDSDVTCQNSRCQLIYRRIIDVSDVEDKVLQKWKTSEHQLLIPKHDDNDDDEEDDGGRKSWDIETMVQEDLPKSESLVEGPGIFKRVTFLSRWEDRIESRGEVYASVGDIHLWDISINGAVAEIDFQLHIAINVYLARYKQWIYSGNPRDIAFSKKYWIFTGFVGPSREQSSPVLVLISDSKRTKKRLLRVVKGIDWLKTGSQFSIITSPTATFGTKEDFDEWGRWWANRVQTFSHKLRTDAERRLGRSAWN